MLMVATLCTAFNKRANSKNQSLCKNLLLFLCVLVSMSFCFVGQRNRFFNCSWSSDELANCAKSRIVFFSNRSWRVFAHPTKPFIFDGVEAAVEKLERDWLENKNPTRNSGNATTHFKALPDGIFIDGKCFRFVGKEITTFKACRLFI